MTDLNRRITKLETTVNSTGEIPEWALQEAERLYRESCQVDEISTDLYARYPDLHSKPPVFIHVGKTLAERQLTILEDAKQLAAKFPDLAAYRARKVVLPPNVEAMLKEMGC